MRTSFLALIVLLAFGLVVASLLIQWIAFFLARVRVHKITIFYGEPITTFTLLRTIVTVGYVPVGGSIVYDDPMFRHRPLLVRLAVILSAPVVLFIVAANLIGLTSASQHFVDAFTQLPLGAIEPQKTAFKLIYRLQKIYESAPSIACAIVTAKFVAYTLFPLGGMVATECVRQLFGERRPPTAYITLSVLISMALGALWAVALGLYAWR